MERRTNDDGFVLFVRAKLGHIVRRYGSKQNIGVTADGSGGSVWDTETIHALGHSDARYLNEYERAIDAGSLERCKREDWEAQRKTKLAKKEEAKKKAAEEAPNAPGKDG